MLSAAEPRVFVAFDFADAAAALSLLERLDPRECGIGAVSMLFEQFNVGHSPYDLREGEKINEAAMRYINRLSDHLFVMARTANADGMGDFLWVPGSNRDL